MKADVFLKSGDIISGDISHNVDDGIWITNPQSNMYCNYEGIFVHNNNINLICYDKIEISKNNTDTKKEQKKQ